jgi:hypothetical protein
MFRLALHATACACAGCDHEGEECNHEHHHHHHRRASGAEAGPSSEEAEAALQRQQLLFSSFGQVLRSKASPCPRHIKVAGRRLQCVFAFWHICRLLQWGVCCPGSKNLSVLGDRASLTANVYGPVRRGLCGWLAGRMCAGSGARQGASCGWGLAGPGMLRCLMRHGQPSRAPAQPSTRFGPLRCRRLPCDPTPGLLLCQAS